MISIKNIYYMLAYAYRTLNEEGFESVGREEFSNIHDLLAAILIKGVASQCKRGLHKEYISRVEITGSLRGQIDMTDSIKQNTLRTKSMVCRYDEFSENNQLNRIVKTAMHTLIKKGDIRDINRKELRKLALFFGNVDLLEPKAIRWGMLTYHRNNASYQMLINVCRLIIDGLLMTEDNGEYKMSKFLDDQQMHQLYERFLLAYFKKEFPQFRASASYIEWNSDDGITDFLPAMKTDVTLSNGEKKLIIDAKYYGRTMQTHSMFNSTSIISSNLYQMFTYVKNRDRRGEGNVSGVILYAKTNEEITPNNDYQIGGNRISVKTLDLGADWSVITSQLRDVAALI